jgi:hypothetical protein
MLLLGYAGAQLVEALRYKSGGLGFDCRWGHRVDSASNRIEYQEYLLGG